MSAIAGVATSKQPDATHAKTLLMMKVPFCRSHVTRETGSFLAQVVYHEVARESSALTEKQLMYVSSCPVSLLERVTQLSAPAGTAGSMAALVKPGVSFHRDLFQILSEFV